MEFIQKIGTEIRKIAISAILLILWLTIVVPLIIVGLLVLFLIELVLFSLFLTWASLMVIFDFIEFVQENGIRGVVEFVKKG